jgi:hypothetical protein
MHQPASVIAELEEAVRGGEADQHSHIHFAISIAFGNFSKWPSF